ncbi:MAG: NADH-quinone oxidoreductase subunit L [Sediminibacterium sp.]|nr:NADH-quinone oxidoreductase subunit L [Sediminibacterium sp.]
MSGDNNLMFLALIPLLMVILPLLGSIILGFSRFKLNQFAIKFIACHTIFISFILSLYLTFWVDLNSTNIYNYFPIIVLNGSYNINFSFQIDNLTLIFTNVITGIGYLIHLFSSKYMNHENNANYGRYFAYLNLFIFFMLLLVMGSNLFVLFIGWEGVGLCSYLLIGYWYENKEYTLAGKKAFIMNRIGDAAFLLAIFWLLNKFGTIEFNYFLNTQLLSAQFSTSEISFIALLLFIGATGKSAQIPLFTWLPDAMAGPTPVSALIHAATMVTAGVYLIIRTHVLFELAPLIKQIILFIGLATMLLSATIALKQKDLKKVLAYSTVSQLGYMFIALGLGMYGTALFHVFTHAFFKALLFLGAGSIIYALHHEQNMFKMGGLKKHLPVTHICFLIGCLALAGIPPLSGFFSKDAILAGLYERTPILWVFGVLGALLTSFYTFRMYFLVFHGQEKYDAHSHPVKEAGIAISLPLIVLAIGAALAGFLGLPHIFYHYNVIQHYLQDILPQIHPSSTSILTEWILIILTIIIALIGIFWSKNRAKNEIDEFPKTHIGGLLYLRWKIDELYNALIVKPYKNIAFFFSSWVDVKIFDGITTALSNLFLYLARQMRYIQNGKIATYLLVAIFTMYLFFIIWFNDISITNFFTKLMK